MSKRIAAGGMARGAATDMLCGRRRYAQRTRCSDEGTHGCLRGHVHRHAEARAATDWGLAAAGRAHGMADRSPEDERRRPAVVRPMGGSAATGVWHVGYLAVRDVERLGYRVSYGEEAELGWPEGATEVGR
jgi:hypothetical protein